MRRHPSLSIASLACLLIPIALLVGEPSFAVDGFRTRLEKWVQTQQLLSEERAGWEMEKETLRATRNMLREEKKALEQEIAQLQSEGTEADDERGELLAKRDSFRRAGDEVLKQRIAAMEKELLEIAPHLPEPLQKKLELLLVQIPEDPAQTELPLGQRMMSVLGVLAQAEKFNDTATFVGETRAVGDGQKVQVRTLYWGLAQAFYIDAQGLTSGIGRPDLESEGGWEFVDAPALRADARRLLDIYEGNVDTIDFVSMPVEIR